MSVEKIRLDGRANFEALGLWHPAPFLLQFCNRHSFPAGLLMGRSCWNGILPDQAVIRRELKFGCGRGDLLSLLECLTGSVRAAPDL
jgi:hypothetical protein